MPEQRYRVTQRLEAGGMAEVYVGEAASVQGFKKKVAIKRVLPHLAQNKNFIGMFLDEARLGARLNHANIVSVFDIGAADDTYFIVMEFIDGANLKKVIEVLRSSGRHIPLKEAIFIVMEACRGLSYAHELDDDEGEALNIVHRDISPPNILISKRGEVKVTDFGLAKAHTQLEKTDPGVVKGKFSYLSPEAADGKPVDARADIFAIGIVLWEMLAGRRLFLGETDYQTVKLVQQANVPSLSRLNPEVDAEFEALLGRALARDPNERFMTARELGDALANYLFSHQLKVTSYDIAALVKKAVEEGGASIPASQQSIIDKLIQEELLRFTSIDDLRETPEPGSQPLAPGEVGAEEAPDGAFEDPSAWFSDDEEVAEAVGQAGSTPSDQPMWRESGLEGLEDMEGIDLSLPPPPGTSSSSANPTLPAPAPVPAPVPAPALAPVAAPTPPAAASPPALPTKPPAEPARPPVSPAPPSEEPATDPGGKPVGLYVALALGLLVIGGVAAFFLGG
ncbi:MAG: serine/threonine-protein kinase [Myxococcota bacterium]